MTTDLKTFRCPSDQILTTILKMRLQKGSIHCTAIVLDRIKLFGCCFYYVHPCKIQSYHLILHPHLTVDCSELRHKMMDWVPSSGLLNTHVTTTWIFSFRHSWSY